MLAVEIGSLITTISFLYALVADGQALFFGLVAVWLWLTVIFANFAESVAEIKGKAKADELRRTRSNLMAKRLKKKRFGSPYEMVPASDLNKGDLVLVQTGRYNPCGRRDRGRCGRDQRVGGHRRIGPGRSGRPAAIAAAWWPGLRSSPTRSSSESPFHQGEAFLDKLITMIETAKRPEDAQRDRARDADAGVIGDLRLRLL